MTSESSSEEVVAATGGSTSSAATTTTSSLSDFFNHVFSLSAEDADEMVVEINEEFRVMLRNHPLNSSMEAIEKFYNKHRVVIDLNDPYMDDAGNYYIHSLLEAINREDVQVVEFLLKNGADPNLDDLNITRFVPQWMLMVACKRGNIRIVKLLLKYGAYINIPSDNGNTALVVASDPENCHPDIVELLTSCGGKKLLPYESNLWKDAIKQYTQRQDSASLAALDRKREILPRISLPNDLCFEEEWKTILSSPVLAAYYKRFLSMLEGVISAAHCLEGQYIHEPLVTKYKRLVQMASDVARQIQFQQDFGDERGQTNGASFVLNVLQYLIKSPSSDRSRRLMIHRVTSAFPANETNRAYVELIARKVTILQKEVLTELASRYAFPDSVLAVGGEEEGEGREMVCLPESKREGEGKGEGEGEREKFVIEQEEEDEVEEREREGERDSVSVIERDNETEERERLLPGAISVPVTLEASPYVSPSLSPSAHTTNTTSTTSRKSLSPSHSSAIEILCDVLTCGINSVTGGGGIEGVMGREEGHSGVYDYSDYEMERERERDSVGDPMTVLYEARERERRYREDHDEHGRPYTLLEKITRRIASQVGPWLLTIFSPSPMHHRSPSLSHSHSHAANASASASAASLSPTTAGTSAAAASSSSSSAAACLSMLEEINSIDSVQRALRILLHDDSLFVLSDSLLVVSSTLSATAVVGGRELSEIVMLRERVQVLEREVNRLENERNTLTSLSCGVV